MYVLLLYYQAFQIQIQIIYQNNMQDQLVMNKLPLPKYFDGVQWNTVIKPSRKYIPKYLHDDLPTLKHLYIKQKFKQIGKFNCPKLDYFDKMIKNKNIPKQIQKKHSQKKHKKQVNYSELKQELQYALIIADKQSNIVDGLLQKAKSCQRQIQKSKQKRSKNRRLSLARDTGKYFGNTVELVFRQRKKQFLDSMRAVEQPDTSVVEQRLKNIKLINLEN